MLARIRKAAEEREGGFTLIELLVVIIIIGILAAIAIPVFLNQRQKGYDAQAKSDLRNLATAEETYLTDHPTTYMSSTDPATDLTAANVTYKHSANVNIAVTANGASGFCEAATSTSGNTYWYDSTNGGLNPTAGSTKPSGGSCGAVTLAAPSVP